MIRTTWRLLFTASLGFAVFPLAAQPAALAGRKLDTLSTDDPSRWARPTRVVLPRFPEQALKEGVTGFVDVDAEIDGAGTGKLLKITSEPKRRDLESAVEQVFEYWRFQVGTTDDCRAKAGQFRSRIWFDIEGGKPKMSFTALEDVEPAETKVRPWAQVINREELEAALMRNYPRDAAALEAEGTIFLKLDVDGATGLPKSIVVTERHGGGSEMRSFSSAAQRAYYNARLEVPEAFRDIPSITVCHSVSFGPGYAVDRR